MKPQLSVRFYQTTMGKEPVRDWLIHELSSNARKTIGEDIKTVQYGWPIGMPIVRKMSPGLWEVRSEISEGIARIFFTLVGTHMVLLHGLIKKSQSTPRHDLRLATVRMKEVTQ